MDVPLEAPIRDVLLVFPTYAAAALSDHPCHTADAKLIDVLLRMFGCQMVRCGSPRLDKMSVSDVNRFRLIVIPCAAYLVPETYEKPRQTTATVLFTGCFAQSFDGGRTPFGQGRNLDGLSLHYVQRPAGRVALTGEHRLTQNLHDMLTAQPVRLPGDESFSYEGIPPGVRVLARCGDDLLLSTRYDGRFVFIHGHLLAGLSYDPGRTPPWQLSGSKDASADEHDPWGLYSSSNPQNALGRALIRNILDHAGVDYRVPDPKPRTSTPYLGDHMEPASISANIAYNNTAEPQELTVRLPWRPRDRQPEGIDGRHETVVTIPPFSYVALQPR